MIELKQQESENPVTKTAFGIGLVSSVPKKLCALHVRACWTACMCTVDGAALTPAAQHLRDEYEQVRVRQKIHLRASIFRLRKNKSCTLRASILPASMVLI